MKDVERITQALRQLVRQMDDANEKIEELAVEFLAPQEVAAEQYEVEEVCKENNNENNEAD